MAGACQGKDTPILFKTQLDATVRLSAFWNIGGGRGCREFGDGMLAPHRVGPVQKGGGAELAIDHDKIGEPAPEVQDCTL
jgi:hypothetical protein